MDAKTKAITIIFVTFLLVTFAMFWVFSSSIYDGTLGKDHYTIEGEILIKQATTNPTNPNLITSIENLKYENTGIFVPLQIQPLSISNFGSNVKIQINKIGENKITEVNLGNWETDQKQINNNFYQTKKLFKLSGLLKGQYQLKAIIYDSQNKEIQKIISNLELK